MNGREKSIDVKEGKHKLKGGKNWLEVEKGRKKYHKTEIQNAKTAITRFPRKRKKKCKYRVQLNGTGREDLKKAAESLKGFTHCVRDIQDVPFFKEQLVWLENKNRAMLLWQWLK